ncbi:MAG: polysaccharide biosynthesis tyrosine autokinase, partial [Bacteroidota bacterium]
MENKTAHTKINPATGNPKDIIILDFQKLLGKMLSYWWLFLLSIAIAIASGNLYLRYSTFMYSARAILLIKDAGKSGKISEQNILLTDDGLTTGGKAMDNEIQILKSLTLMEKVVERLNLHVAYFRQGTVIESELYLNTPFLLDSFELYGESDFGATFYMELSDYETFLFKENPDDEEHVQCYFGVPFQTNSGRFLINLNPKRAIVKGSYRLSVFPKEAAAFQYKSDLNVQRIGDHSSSSVLELSIVDPVSEKARDILNTLIDIYNEEEVKDENKVLRNTLEFIDKRVLRLVSELDSVEGGIQRYKSANSIISDNASTSMSYTLGEIRSAVQQISDFDIQKKLLESLEQFLTKDQNKFDLIPTNLIAENPVLAGLVTQYNNLVLRNNQISITASSENPVRKNLEEQIIDIRGLILETIRNLKNDLQIPIAKIEDNIQELRQSMGVIPGIEKRLIEQMRTQAVKEKLFLFLLQKREETALSEAVTTAKTRTIDHARNAKFPVYPRRKLIWLFSAVLGVLVPFLLILVMGLFETKIDTEDSVKQITTIPILGRIAQNKGKEHIIVKQGSRSAINEMFRLLRTNLNFINHSKPQQTIMVTSSVSGEGKTFIALNLGVTLALSGKKVVLLGLDLRKPKMRTYLEAGEGDGITNYLVGQSPLDDLIQVYPHQKNLHFVTCGTVPPNPAELILSDRMQQLLKELQERYDYILIDTPPIGLVSDALLLRQSVDNILIVVRHKFTQKGMVRHLENMYQDGELNKATLILNGVKNGKSYYGYGGYYYGCNQLGRKFIFLRHSIPDCSHSNSHRSHSSSCRFS